MHIWGLPVAPGRVSLIRFTTRSWVQGFPNLSANIGNFVGQKKQRPRNLLKREVKCRRALCFECAEMTKCISFDWRSCQFVSWMESLEKRFDGRPVVSSSGTSRHRGPSCNVADILNTHQTMSLLDCTLHARMSKNSVHKMLTQV